MKKTNSVVINKQTTNVHVCVACGKRTKQRMCERCKRKKRSVKIVTEVICGKINQECDGKEVAYFQSFDVRPSAVLRVKNDSGCRMDAIIESKERRIIQTIEPYQQFFAIFPLIGRLLIQCHKDDHAVDSSTKICKGEFALKLRIPKMIPIERNKTTRHG